MEIPKYFREELVEKVLAAYPNHFSKALKEKGGIFYPADYPRTDDQIRAEIARDDVGFDYSFSVIEMLFSSMSPIGYRIVDLGGGYGVEALLMAEMKPGLQVTVLEADIEKVRLLQQVIKTYEFADGTKAKDRIFPIQGDIITRPELNSKYDAVLVKDVISLIAGSIKNPEPRFKDPDFLKQFLTHNILRDMKEYMEHYSCVVIADRDVDEAHQTPFVEGVREAGLEPVVSRIPTSVDVGGIQVYDNLFVISAKF